VKALLEIWLMLLMCKKTEPDQDGKQLYEALNTFKNFFLSFIQMDKKLRKKFEYL